MAEVIVEETAVEVVVEIDVVGSERDGAIGKASRLDLALMYVAFCIRLLYIYHSSSS